MDPTGAQRQGDNNPARHLPQEIRTLVTYLRYGSPSKFNCQRVWHSVHTIQRLTGLKKNEVLCILREQQLKRESQRIRRRVASQPYSPEQVQFLTSHETLERWKTLSIAERLQKLKERYPAQKHTEYRLRQLYKKHKIKLRPIGLEIQRTEKQKADIIERKLGVFPAVTNLIENGETVLFLDEAMFTVGQTRASTWMATKQKICVTKKKVGYSSIAAVSCIDQCGKVQATHLADGSIDTREFMTFLKTLFSKYKHQPISLYMDNLPLHKAIVVRDLVEDNDSQILFSPPYSSEFNPIERLWAFAKRTFRKQCILNGDYSNLDQIKALVIESIYQSPQEGLRKKVASCIEQMRMEMHRLGYQPPQRVTTSRQQRFKNRHNRQILQQQRN